jgi:hypothetical protein
MKADQHRNLPRLSADFYRGQAYVHWTMTIQERATGWLDPAFHFRFRETHTFDIPLCVHLSDLLPDARSYPLAMDWHR